MFLWGSVGVCLKVSICEKVGGFVCCSRGIGVLPCGASDYEVCVGLYLCVPDCFIFTEKNRELPRVIENDGVGILVGVMHF